MQNSIENNMNKDKDKKNLRMFTQYALKSGINEEDLAKVIAITNKSRDAEEKGEIQEEEELIMN